MRRIQIAIAVMLICWPALSAQAKSTEERLSDLEKRLSSVQQTYLTNNADIASAIARSESIQQEFSSIKGAVETNKYLIEAQRQELMRRMQELEHRLQAIEERLDIFSTQINQAIGKVSPQAADEGALYEKALAKANRGEYLDAAADFQAFIKKYPKSTFAPSAKYWIGECYFSMKDFKRSIKEFQLFIESNPRSEKVPSAILKQGSSFYELGLLDDAKAFFEKIIKEYPRSSEASQAQSKLDRIKQKQAGGEAVTPPPSTGPAVSSYPAETIQQQREKYKQQPAAAGQTPEQTKPAETTKNERRYIEF
jgi:tol-pal system protein YbgF